MQTKLNYESTNMFGREVLSTQYGTNLVSLTVKEDTLELISWQLPDTASVDFDQMVKTIQADFPNKTLVIKEKHVQSH